MEDSTNKRPQFGTRYLTDATKVFEHNAWDNVEWDDEQEQEALEKVERNSQVLMSEEKRETYEQEAALHWDAFYSQHNNRFFKDRHWLFTEFPDLMQLLTAAPNIATTNIDSAAVSDSNSNEVTESKTKESSKLVADSWPGESATTRLFEVGCGVGNTVFPLLQASRNPGLYIYSCDLSPVAVQLVQQHPDYDSSRCHAFVRDITDVDVPYPFPDGSIDIITVIFVLSAIPPAKMQATINRLARLLKPGGVLVFRDYGLYDLAQLRFKNGQCVEKSFYVRGDGTFVYFFNQEELRTMFTKAGLVEEQNYVDRRLQVNRGKQIKMYRIWLQCRYRQPLYPPPPQ